jgi:hypothetical protein
LPKPRHAKVAVIGLLLLLLLSASDAAALTLPNPPDTSAPANNQPSSSLAVGAQSFPGGVLLVRNGSTDQNVSAYEFVAEFYCYEHENTYAWKQFATGLGESVSGSLSAAQASGVIDAINSVKPPKTVPLSVSVGQDDPGGNLTYVIHAMVYNVTTYSVWVANQQSPPVAQRVGYITVSIPEHPEVTRLSLDLAGSSCSSSMLLKYGAGFTSSSPEHYQSPNPPTFSNGPLDWISAPPEGGFSPILTYGTVRVLSSAGVTGGASIKPGENVTFALPPGKYKAVADVSLFGIPFAVTLGTYSSPAGATTAQFAVSLTNMYDLWYGLELVVLIIVVAVLFILNRRLHLLKALVQASRYFGRGLRFTWRRIWD